jgi:hypothetical protein
LRCHSRILDDFKVVMVENDNYSEHNRRHRPNIDTVEEEPFRFFLETPQVSASESQFEVI